MSRKIILIKQELLLLVYELNRSGLLAENEKIRPILAQLEKLFKIVVIDIQITLKQMLRDFIGIRVNRAKKSGMVNITSSVNSRERSGINTILHELNPLFTINVTMR